MTLIAGGAAGLLLGMAVQRCGLTDRREVRASMALRRRNLLRRVMLALGWAMVLTAFLGWLAVIDVDLLEALPLHGGTLLGGAALGIAAGVCGSLPGLIPAMAGGDRFLEGLSGTAGCLAGAWLVPKIVPKMGMVRELFAPVEGTLFRVMLEGPYLFGGGFLALACLGAVVMALALMIQPEPCPEPLPPTVPPPETTEDAPIPEPEDAAEETVVVALPGEEVVVVDTAEEQEAGSAEVDGPTEEEASPETGEATEKEAGESVPEEDQLG